MKQSIEELADRFDELAPDYDADTTAEYRACVSLVIEHATRRSAEDDVVLDLGTGTGAIALALAPHVAKVIGRDISDGMMTEARRNAADRGIENVEFGRGSFRDPGIDADVDLVVSNFAMHHLSDDEKREAINIVAALQPRAFVLGDVMFFAEPNADGPCFNPEVDDPATVGILVDAFTDAGFAITAVEAVHEQIGVIVGERLHG